MEEEPDTFRPALVHLAPFSPSTCPLSICFNGPSRPIQSARRLAYVSLQGVLVNAEEASSAKSICGASVGGFSREEAVAWELFTPIQRFLIVAVIGVAAAESKKNRVIRRLEKSVDLRDQLLSSMQQKLDDLCKQLNLIKDQSGTESAVSYQTNVEMAFKENFGYEKIKFMECGCWLCDQHHQLLPSLEDKPLAIPKTSMGHHEMLHETTNLVINNAEPEERRMSDMSDWCSSVTSSADVHFNNLSLDQDMMFLRKECQEKDATIKELTSFLQSNNKANSKRISELEDIIRRKNMVITRLKKDMMVLEQKVTQLIRLGRSSSSAISEALPIMMDNLLYDMDATTSPSSSDSDTPSIKPRAQLLKPPVASTSEQSHKSAPTKSLDSRVKSAESQPVTPLQELSMNQKPVSSSSSSSSSSSRQRRVLSTGHSKKTTRSVQTTSRDSASSRKRWV